MTLLRPSLDALLVAAVIFAAAMLGIYTRQAGFIAAFWPANPLMVGLLVRVPRLAHPLCWAGVFAGFVAADLLTGGELGLTVAFTASNMAFMAVTWLVLRRLPGPDRRLERAESILWVGLACVAGSIASGIIGMYTGSTYFGTPPADALATWFTGELAGALAVLPVVLAAPRLSRRWWRWPQELAPTLRRAAGPAAVLLVLLVAGVYIGGPAAIAVAVPALLLCALLAGVFATALLTLIAIAWTLVAMVHGGVDLVGYTVDRDAVLGVQFALALMALGPIAVSANVAHHQRTLNRLSYVADHDALTGALNRAAFERECERRFLQLHGERRPVAVVMADLDHFKQINDQHGHPVGDRVLAILGTVVPASLRDSDLFARIGGEEFCIVVAGAGAGPLAAQAAAERIRVAFSAAVVEVGAPPATVSLGVAHREVSPTQAAPLIAEADRALYAAKAGGRDRVAMATAVPAAAIEL